MPTTLKVDKVLSSSMKHQINLLSSSMKHQINLLSSSMKHQINLLSSSMKHQINLLSSSMKHQINLLNLPNLPNLLKNNNKIIFIINFIFFYIKMVHYLFQVGLLVEYLLQHIYYYYYLIKRNLIHLHWQIIHFYQ